MGTPYHPDPSTPAFLQTVSVFFRILLSLATSWITRLTFKIGTACYVLSKAARNQALSDGVIQGRFNLKAGPVLLQYDVGKNRARAAIPHDVHTHQKTLTRAEVCGIQPPLARASESGRITLKENFPIVSIVNGST
jgi:L-cysteine desulfidase